MRFEDAAVNGRTAQGAVIRRRRSPTAQRTCQIDAMPPFRTDALDTPYRPSDHRIELFAVPAVITEAGSAASGRRKRPRNNR